ncbi:MAG: hypothetical protein M1483_04955 [Actinobacteria bacterium]|nr:hypothetical protein [Actinomycetota bacterium]MCL6104963.1 hypothetical protein [Actinomycetota bacterium]
MSWLERFDCQFDSGRIVSYGFAHLTSSEKLSKGLDLHLIAEQSHQHIRVIKVKEFLAENPHVHIHYTSNPFKPAEPG